VRSQFDCSVPLQILAVEIMFFDAYYVTYFKKKKIREFMKRNEAQNFCMFCFIE